MDGIDKVMGDTHYGGLDRRVQRSHYRRLSSFGGDHSDNEYGAAVYGNKEEWEQDPANDVRSIRVLGTIIEKMGVGRV